MASPSLFRELFAEASTVSQPSLSSWFDQKTARFGGREAIATVRELVGHSARFDFGHVAAQLPRIDLPALRPFLHTMLALNRRKVREDEDGLSFRTPEEWLSDPAVRTSYRNLTFDRHDRSRDATQRVLGVGHPALDQALRQALALTSCATLLPRAILDRPLGSSRSSIG
jgi:hypothetical protein